MEPRIATLLGDSTSPLERSAGDALSWLPPPSAAPRRPHPVEPTTANDSGRVNTVQVTLKRQKPSVPIAGVLNTVTPFSGRLSDLLLDPSQQQQAPKRKRLDEPADASQPTGPENSLLTLPKPHQQPKKNTKRPRIPPLLQGLHQVPPQAQSRLFPPITSESAAFGRDVGEGVGLRTTSGPERRNEEKSATPPKAPPENRSPGAQEDGRGGEGAGAGTGPRAKTAAASMSDKENRATADRSTLSSATKELRKRNKWSDQETRDLLVGVSRFGIGSWKKILQCSDFTFHQRTAVDLKDRFRTCCPGEGLKAKKPKRKGNIHDANSQTTTTISTTTSIYNNQNVVARETLHTINTLRKNREGNHRKGPAELREMGIHGTFTKNFRRERRAFTAQDDENLLKGFEKYASSWHLMRDDKDLGFSTRQPTDLRDRFRIRYPEKFAKAGYKLKPKDELMLKEKEKEKNKDSVNSHAFVLGESSPSSSRAKDSTTDTSLCSLTSTASSNSNLMPLALRESFLTSFTGPLDDFGDLASEEDGDNSRSPIILNRNIFEWADANPSQMTAISAATLPSMGTIASDAPLNTLNGTDGMHINPMVTLNLPTALPSSNVLSSTTLQPSVALQPASSRLPDPYQHTSTASAATISNTTVTVPTSRHTTIPLLRTPNLPTIVFPHVPASSARSAVHNLPPPADLLSGLETDVRPEMQPMPFLLEDNLGIASAGTNYVPNAMLAPMNGVSSREMLTLDKGLLQELNRGG